MAPYVLTDPTGAGRIPVPSPKVADILNSTTYSTIELFKG